MSKPKHRVTVVRAEQMAAEERTLTCETCTAPTPRDGEKYCLSCKSYWEDVRNGLWSDES